MASPRASFLVPASIATILVLVGGSSDVARAAPAHPVVIGVGAHPLTPVHASAWFLTRSDSLGKELVLLLYIVGPPGWTGRDTRFESTAGDSARIRMVAGTVPIEILYDAASGRATISGRSFDVARDNVFVLGATGGNEPSIRGLGVRTLTFPPLSIPAVELLAREAAVREALAGPAPGASPRADGGEPAPAPPAEALALDAEGLRLLRSGVPGADARGCSLFARAAALGWAVSEYHYGLCLQRGIGSPQDDRAANEWFRKAAGRGDANSAFKLGWSYRTGRGVPADSSVAFGWFRRCAALGDSICQALVAQAFEQGDGTPVHADSARFWYTRSAERGVPDAQLALARLAVESPTGGEDGVIGLLWLDVLAAGLPPLEDERLPKFRRVLEERLSEAERRRARARADAWLAEHSNRAIHRLAR